jgi:hypothetical protein
MMASPHRLFFSFFSAHASFGSSIGPPPRLDPLPWLARMMVEVQSSVVIAVDEPFDRRMDQLCRSPDPSFAIIPVCMLCLADAGG